MKNSKDFKDLGVGQRMNLSEKLGSKVAIIMNKAREKCNKILQPTGYGVNINVDFYRLDQAKSLPVESETIKEEVNTNG